MKSLWEAPPHIVHQQIPRYGHKDVNGLTFAAGALCFESAHISNQPFNYLHAGRYNLMVLPRSKNVIAFALNKSNSSLLTEIEITELLSQSWRPPGVEQKIHCWQTLSGKRFWFSFRSVTAVKCAKNNINMCNKVMCIHTCSSQSGWA